jgi:hypothetical protein
VLQRCLALAVVGGAWPRGDRHLSAIAWPQGFSSCSPVAFPHQWVVWWGEAKQAAASAPPSASRIFIIRAEAEDELSRGSPLRRQRPAPSFSDLGEGRSPPVSLVVAARLAPRHERLWCCIRCRPPLLVLAAPPAVGGSHNTSHAVRAAFVFWDGPVLVLVARTGVRTCGCALGRTTYAGVAPSLWL